MKNQKFICHSGAKEQFNYKKEPLGMGNDRALYYSKQIGKGRIYRSSYPEPSDNGLTIFDFNSQQEADALCARINEAYNDDFKPMAL